MPNECNVKCLCGIDVVEGRCAGCVVLRFIQGRVYCALSFGSATSLVSSILHQDDLMRG